MTTSWQHKLTPADPTATELACVVASIRPISENEDGTVFVVGDTAEGEKFRGVIDARGQIIPGERYTLLGAWQEHPRYGWQFACTDLVRDVPTDTLSLISFLAKHCSGVGPVTAAALVQAHGPDVVRLLTESSAEINPEILSPSEAQAAGDSLATACGGGVSVEVHRQMHQLLRGHGFWAKTSSAALRIWKGLAPDRIRRDPFVLLTRGLPGAGFVRCDRLYLACGRPPHRLKRQALAAWYTIACLDGDTWTPAAKTLAAVRQKIGGARLRERRALAMLHRAGLACSRIDAGGRVWVADRDKAVGERVVAMRLQALSSDGAEWPQLPEDAPCPS